MSEHVLGTGDALSNVGVHHDHSSAMLTDGGGHPVSNVTVGHDGSTLFSDDQGMAAGSITTDLHGEHIQNMAGQSIAHVDHGIIYDAANLPQAQMFTHGNTTELYDLSGHSVGHIVRTSNGSLIFDGGYPPHQLASVTPL